MAFAFAHGNLARQAELLLVYAIVGGNLMPREALIRKTELLREELTGPSPSPVERLLVERVVACWLQVQEADVRFSQSKGEALPWAEFLHQRIDRATRHRHQ